MHELEKLEDGTFSVLRANDSPAHWHGLETIMSADASFDDWRNSPVFGWKIQRSKVRYAVDREGTQLEMPEQHVLFRSDNHKPLSVVSEDYHVVQPLQMLDFFKGFCEKNHLTMDTAGYIRGGVKFWALARTGNEFAVGNKDVVKQYVLLASSCDSSMATTGKHTSLRVVCSNTFHASINNGESAVKVRHSREFSETEMAINLGLMDDEFEQMALMAGAMQESYLSVPDAVLWFAELVSGKVGLDVDSAAEVASRSRVFTSLWDSYLHAPGAEFTLWGAFNAVTHNVDWIKGRSPSTRFDAAQFGTGATLKQKAWDKAVSVIEAARTASEAVSVASA